MASPGPQVRPRGPPPGRPPMMGLPRGLPPRLPPGMMMRGPPRMPPSMGPPGGPRTPMMPPRGMNMARPGMPMGLPPGAQQPQMPRPGMNFMGPRTPGVMPGLPGFTGGPPRVTGFRGPPRSPPGRPPPPIQLGMPRPGGNEIPPQFSNAAAGEQRGPVTPSGSPPGAMAQSIQGLRDTGTTLSFKQLKLRNLKVPSISGSVSVFLKFKIGEKESASDILSGNNAEFKFENDISFFLGNENSVEIAVFQKTVTGQEMLLASASVNLGSLKQSQSLDSSIQLKDKSGLVKGDLSFVSEYKGPVLEIKDAMDVDKSEKQVEEPIRELGEFTDNEIKIAFDSFDLDKNTFLSAAELKHILVNIGESVLDEEIDEMIKMCDKDGDGQVSFDEFYTMITNGKEVPDYLKPVSSSNNTSGPGKRKKTNAGELLAARNKRKAKLKDFSKDNNIQPESVKKAFKRFKVIDSSAGKNSGLVDFGEFCEILNIEAGNPNNEDLFKLFDRKGNGKVDMREFIISLLNFSGASKDEKLKFGFMVFDEDGNNVITKEELLRILKANHMAGTDDEVKKKVDTIMAQADKNGDGVLNFEEFVLVSKKFPNILWPRI